jgi:YidC/Oxa1 family membrane protein insertase
VDKRTVIGFVFIGLIIILYPVYMQWMTGGESIQEAPPQPQGDLDTLQPSPASAEGAKEIAPPGLEVTTTSLAPEDTLGEEKVVRVETHLYAAEFSSRGGVLKSFTLKKYQHYQGGEIQLLPPDQPHSTLDLIFPDSGISLEAFNFRVDRDRLLLDERNPEGTVGFSLTTQSGAQITKRYSFLNGTYHFGLELEIKGPAQLDLGRKYLLGWGSGLSSTEKDRRGDLDKFTAYSMMGKELSDHKKFHQPKGERVGTLQEAGSGETKWVATRTKYFVAAMVPQTRDGMGFSASGKRSLSFTEGEETEAKRLGVFLEMPLERSAGLRDSFMIYVGPIDYFILKGYGIGLDRMVDLSKSIIRPFSLPY